MSTIRVEKNKGYSVISNIGLNDPNLSYKAKGILAYLLSKPDDWKCVVSDLSKNAKDGRDSVYGGLQELRKYGYMIKRPIRNSQGKVVEWEEVVYEAPEEKAKKIYEEQLKRRELNKQEKKNPLPDFPETDKSTSGKSGNGLSGNGLSEYGKPVNIINTDTPITDIPSTDTKSTDYKEKETLLPTKMNSMIIKKYKDCISKKISDEEKFILFSLQQTIDVNIILKAIILAAVNNAKSINYIKATLDDWIEKGLDTLDAVNLHLSKWINENRQAKKNREQMIKRRSANKDNYNKPKTNFADYEQREYDYDELERKLLGWGN